VAANGQVVNAPVTFTYDGVSQKVQRGAVIDVPNGSAIQTAIGGGNLTALNAQMTGGSPGVPFDGLASARVNMSGSYNSGQN
jgi:hypothetical protein